MLHRLNGQRRLSFLVAAIVVLVIGALIFRGPALAPPPITQSEAQVAQPTAAAAPTAEALSLAAPAVVTPDVAAPAVQLALSVAGLHVQGGQLLNAAGQPVVLRGVNRSGAEYACMEGAGWTDGPANAAEVAAMKSWGITVARVTLNEDCWLNINGAPVGGTAYQTPVVAYVNLLTSNGIAADINLHFNAPGAHKATEQEPMADRDHSPAFWASVATAFKGNGSVLLEPYNEPHDISWACWRDGGCTVQGSQSGEGSFVVAGMNEMIAAIRSTGATNPVIATGANWGSDLSGWLQYKPTDSANQLIAGVHNYSDGLSCENVECWNSVIAPIQATNPVINTEMGEFDCGHGDIDPVMAWYDSRGIGYMAWTWGPFSCSQDPALLTDWNGTPTQTYGSGYKAHLLAMAEQPTPTAAPTVAATNTPERTATARATSTATATATATGTVRPAPTNTPTPPSNATATPTATAMGGVAFGPHMRQEAARLTALGIDVGTAVANEDTLRGGVFTQATSRGWFLYENTADSTSFFPAAGR